MNGFRINASYDLFAHPRIALRRFRSSAIVIRVASELSNDPGQNRLRA